MFFVSCFGLISFFDEHKANEIRDAEDQDGDCREDEAALHIAVRLKGVHDVADCDGHHDTGEQRDCLLGGTEACAVMRLDVGVTPVINNVGYEKYAARMQKTAMTALCSFAKGKNGTK